MNEQERALRRKVWAHYRHHGRHDLPWRETRDPYKIMVSEVMLQQTQVARVVPKYRAFVRRFPTVRALARAPLGDVLVLWQGLGYNRRGKALHDAARMIVEVHAGRVPGDRATLCTLPGIGPYTADAIRAFAYNEPVAMIETNIRTVLLHELLKGREQVHDRELEACASRLVPHARAREWYWALMDYGAHLKGEGVRLNNKSKHYTKQSAFKGSDREVRGAILRTLAQGPMTGPALTRSLGLPNARVRKQTTKLLCEGLIRRSGRKLSLY